MSAGHYGDCDASHLANPEQPKPPQWLRISTESSNLPLVLPSHQITFTGIKAAEVATTAFTGPRSWLKPELQVQDFVPRALVTTLFLIGASAKDKLVKKGAVAVSSWIDGESCRIYISRFVRY